MRLTDLDFLVFLDFDFDFLGDFDLRLTDFGFLVFFDLDFLGDFLGSGGSVSISGSVSVVVCCDVGFGIVSVVG